VELLSVDRVDLSLGSTREPLVIDDVEILSPKIRLIRKSEGGLVGIRPPRISAPATQPSLKISQNFQLRQMLISNADVVFEDRSVANAPPMSWRNLKLIASSSPDAPGQYSYEVAGGDEKTGTISASGRFNVDDPAAQIEKCTIRVVVNTPANESALPPAVQRAASEARCAGALAVELTGHASTARGSSDISRLFDSATAEIRVVPRELTMQPQGFSDPIRDFAELNIHIADGKALFETLRAQCRDDSLLVRRAVASLKDLPHSIHFEELAGAVVLQSPHPAYPSPVAKVLAEIDPRGPYFLDGTASIGFGGDRTKFDYRIHVATERGEISTKRYHVSINNVVLDSLVTPAVAEINKFSGETLSGKVTGKGRAQLASDVIAYAVEAQVRNIDLTSLAQATAKPGDKPIAVAGVLDLDVDLQGRGAGESALDSLAGRGHVHVAKGNLFQVPVMQDILQRINLERAATASDASSYFTLAKRTFQLSDASVTSLTLGVEGNGTVGFDGKLDLRVIVNALSDWEERIKQLNTPVTDVAGRIAGAVQQGFNTVAKTLLYQLHVGGTVQKPEVRVIAAPVLHR